MLRTMELILGIGPMTHFDAAARPMSACANGETSRRDYVNRGGFGFTHLYSSLMVRALATASYLSVALNVPLVVWEDLHEVGGIFVIDDEYVDHNEISFVAKTPRTPRKSLKYY